MQKGKLNIMKHFLIAILFASIAITIVLNKINKNKEGKASMQLNTFKLEDFYAQYEFKTTYRKLVFR